jgi:hypothetical protein
VSLLRGLSLRRGSRCRRRLFRWVLGLRLRRLSSRTCLRTMARTVRKELRLTPELVEGVDRARGDVSFNRFVENALLDAVGDEPRSTLPREVYASPALERQFYEGPPSFVEPPPAEGQRVAGEVWPPPEPED